MQRTETRKADRSFMTEQVQELAERLDLDLEIIDVPEHREIMLSLKAKSGLSLHLSFDGKSCQPDVYLLSWVVDYNCHRQLNDATFGGNVNPYHKQKATYIARGFKELMAMVEKGFAMANDGSAYLLAA